MVISYIGSCITVGERAVGWRGSRWGARRRRRRRRHGGTDRSGTSAEVDWRTSASTSGTCAAAAADAVVAVADDRCPWRHASPPCRLRHRQYSSSTMSTSRRLPHTSLFTKQRQHVIYKNKIERKRNYNLTNSIAHIAQTALLFDTYLLINLSLCVATASATSQTQNIFIHSAAISLKSFLAHDTTRWKVLRESTTPRESEILAFLSTTLGNTCHTYY